MRPEDVVGGELEAVGERFVDVSFCGEVHDGVDSLRDQQVGSPDRSSQCRPART